MDIDDYTETLQNQFLYSLTDGRIGDCGVRLQHLLDRFHHRGEKIVEVFGLIDPCEAVLRQPTKHFQAQVCVLHRLNRGPGTQRGTVLVPDVQDEQEEVRSNRMELLTRDREAA
jgi:hypothetical protein